MFIIIKTLYLMDILCFILRVYSHRTVFAINFQPYMHVFLFYWGDQNVCVLQLAW